MENCSTSRGSLKSLKNVSRILGLMEHSAQWNNFTVSYFYQFSVYKINVQFFKYKTMGKLAYFVEYKLVGNCDIFVVLDLNKCKERNNYVIQFFNRHWKLRFSWGSKLLILRLAIQLIKVHSFFYKNSVFLFQAEYSYFSADFRLKIFLWIFLDYGNTRWTMLTQCQIISPFMTLMALK